MPHVLATSPLLHLYLGAFVCVMLSACSQLEYHVAALERREGEKGTLSFSGAPLKNSERSLGEIRLTHGTPDRADDTVLEIRKDQSRYMAETLVMQGKASTTRLGLSYDKEHRALGLRLRVSF